LDKKVCFSKLMRLCLSEALISLALLGASECFVLTTRGAKIFGPRIGEAAAWVVGDDGALIVLASDGAVVVATLVMLETEDIDWWRPTTGRLERKPWSYAIGSLRTLSEREGRTGVTAFLTGVLTARKFFGKGMWKVALVEDIAAGGMLVVGNVVSNCRPISGRCGRKVYCEVLRNERGRQRLLIFGVKLEALLCEYHGSAPRISTFASRV
jgi:hypothetical protein